MHTDICVGAQALVPSKTMTAHDTNVLVRFLTQDSTPL